MTRPAPNKGPGQSNFRNLRILAELTEIARRLFAVIATEVACVECPVSIGKLPSHTASRCYRLEAADDGTGLQVPVAAWRRALGDRPLRGTIG